MFMCPQSARLLSCRMWQQSFSTPIALGPYPSFRSSYEDTYAASAHMDYYITKPVTGPRDLFEACYNYESVHFFDIFINRFFG